MAIFIITRMITKFRTKLRERAVRKDEKRQKENIIEIVRIEKKDRGGES